MNADWSRRVAENWARVSTRVESARARAGRFTDSITVVAVSKTMPPQAISAALDAGLRHFGENRVEEAAEKIPGVHELLAGGREPPGVTWHMVGHLQSRKAARAVSLFSVVHSVDSVRLARRLGQRCSETGKTVRILLEMNVSGETSKNGLSADRYGENAIQRDEMHRAVELILAIPGLQVSGVMTMAPIVRDPEMARPYFRALQEVREDLAVQFPSGDWSDLSMGMTDDFEVAVEEGATLLRIGRAIFGPRHIDG